MQQIHLINTLTQEPKSTGEGWHSQIARQTGLRMIRCDMYVQQEVASFANHILCGGPNRAASSLPFWFCLT